MFGMLRTTWSWPRNPISAAVVAPAMTDRTSWPSRRLGPISRPTLASIWGLMARTTTSAPAIASMFEAVTRMPYWRSRCVAPLGPRVTGDDLAGLDELAAEEAGDHRLGHDAGADGRDGPVGQGGHGRRVYRRPTVRTGRMSGPIVRASRPSPRRQLVAVPRRKNRSVVADRRRGEPGGAKGRLELGRVVVDLGDREGPAVVEPPDHRLLVRSRSVVDGRRGGIEARIDEGEAAARSRASGGRCRGTLRGGPRGTWLSQKPVNRASATASGSAQASRTWRWARRPWATSRSRARSRGAGAPS